MPTVEVVSLQDAQLELSLTGKRGVMMRQYMDYIGQLKSLTRYRKQLMLPAMRSLPWAHSHGTPTSTVGL